MRLGPITGIVLSFPILAGKVEAWRRFVQELSGSRRKQYENSRQQLGITRERMSLKETPYGATSITTLEAPDIAQALGNLIASTRSFDTWYRQRLRELHGVDLSGYEQYSQPWPLPQDQQVYFEWELQDAVDGSSTSTPTMYTGKEQS